MSIARSTPTYPTGGLAANLARLVIAAYRFVLSPLIGPACRFAPTCSAYADEAIARHGLARGGLMAFRRLLRCHPFNPGGFDPVA
jgi:putative membrane protein insertion efficiency factor